MREVGWRHSTCETVNEVSGGRKAATMVNIVVKNRYRTQMLDIYRRSAYGEDAEHCMRSHQPDAEKLHVWFCEGQAQ